MMRSSIGKTLAANRKRKMAVGSKVMPGVKPLSGMQTKIPGGTGAPMKKGGSAQKPKMGIAIMIAVGKKKGKK
jgi:hypothetical protein